MNLHVFRNLVLMGWMLVVAACHMGGGGMSGNHMATTGMTTSGTGSTGMSSGPVMAFGSVFVNGVEFNTSNSTVMLNGSPGPDETMDPHRGLMIGMVVEVEGMFDSNGTSGTATSITFKDNLEGPISGITMINATTNQLVVLGQTVIVDSQTAFEGATFATLAVGNVIEVSGMPDNMGIIHATFIELKAANFTPGMEIEVKGTVQNLNASAKTFQINALTVDFASVMNLPVGLPANGQFVEVKGTTFAGSELIADNIELEDNNFGVMDVDEAQVEGFVTAMTSQSNFMVGVQQVQTMPSTVFEGGVAGDIALGKELETEGALASGVLTATKVSFH
jgi:hypothetical protein